MDVGSIPTASMFLDHNLKEAMSSYASNELKTGLKVMLDQEPCHIIEIEFVKPGKGQAFNRIKLRQLRTGRVLERTLKAAESIEAADVQESTMIYLYQDGSEWVFMDESSYEQSRASESAMIDARMWIKEQDICVVTLFNGQPISVTPPKHVILTVTETDPGLKGDTSGGGGKPATVETGAVIRVPLFIQIGEKIRIDTRTSAYISRAKDES